MYWPRSDKVVNVESLEETLREEARGSGDTFELVRRLGRTEEEREEETTEEEEEENESKSILKRSKSQNNQLKKKQSISNIQQLNIRDSTSSINIFAGNNNEDSDITMANAFDHNATWARIKQLTITSKHFTARDKNEILAQEPTFDSLDDLTAIAQALQNDAARKARIERLISNACQQLKLYYLVGSEGWATAVSTIKSNEAARLGVPEPKHIAKPSIVYVNQRSNYNQQSSFGYNKKKPTYGRHSYKKE